MAPEDKHPFYEIFLPPKRSKRMKPFTFLLTFFLSPILLSQTWQETEPVPGAGRDDGIAFSAIGFGFVVTGNQGGFLESNELWAYFPKTDEWFGLSDFPGTPRQYAGSFVLNDEAYVLMGISDAGVPLNDVWKYDPRSDHWSQLNDFPGKARWSFFAFDAMNTGVIGTGTTLDSLLEDVWRYDPETDSWTAMENFPGGKRREAVAFSIAESGYVGLGYDTFGGTGFRNDFYSWNLLTDTWQILPDFPEAGRAYATAVATNHFGYVGTGQDEAGVFQPEIYAYDPANAGWQAVASLPENVRGMSGFGIGDEPFFLTGLDDSFTRISKGWKLAGAAAGTEELTAVYPNPTSSDAMIKAPNGSRVELLATDGRRISDAVVSHQHAYLLTDLPKGSYYVRITAPSETVSKLIVVH